MQIGEKAVNRKILLQAVTRDKPSAKIRSWFAPLQEQQQRHMGDAGKICAEFEQSTLSPSLLSLLLPLSCNALFSDCSLFLSLSGCLDVSRLFGQTLHMTQRLRLRTRTRLDSCSATASGSALAFGLKTSG